MIRDTDIVATAQDHGERLDRVVAAHCPGTTRAFILAALARGDITLNGRPGAKGAKLAAGERVRIRMLLERVDNRVQPNAALPLTVIHEDAALLVLDKPAGMPVHPLAPDETNTLANALLAREPALAAIGDDPLFPALAHRLDTDTSGLILAARTREAYDFLREAFRGHRVRKTYVALVRGAPPASGHLDQFLAHNPARPGHMLVYAEPPPHPKTRPMRAVTDFALREPLRGYALLDVTIATGVTHQIRAQLAAAGHPIAGDRLYGGAAGEGELGLTRHFLHAAEVEFAHPATGAAVRFQAPLPAELLRVVEGLRA